jgi:DNA topoisomerase-1
VRRRVARHLAGKAPTRELALAAVIELVARTAIRPGSDTYARQHGTRGAVTLLKSNVRIERGEVVLDFIGKGSKPVVKRCQAPGLRRALEVVRKLPGERLFQYRNGDGAVHAVRRGQVNAFLRELAGCDISLKDLRTLYASAAVLEQLAPVEPAASARARRRQVLNAVRATADELVNTPAICRRSYVHQTVVTAFEAGKLKRHAAELKRARSPARRERALAKVVAVEVL